MSDEISRRPAASIDPETTADEAAADPGSCLAAFAPPAGAPATGEAVESPPAVAASPAVTGPVPAMGSAALAAFPVDPGGPAPVPDSPTARLPAELLAADDAVERDETEETVAAEPDDHQGGGEGPEIARFGDTLGAEDLSRLSDILLAVLFASEAPLTAARLGHAAGASAAQVRRGLEQLEQRIEEQRLPLLLQETAGQFRLLTAPAFHDHLLRLRAIKKAERLTPAALETLAVVAYRQPVIRAEIEAIRGVKAGPVLRLLLDKKLIRTGERKDVPGRPIQYETTKEFLDRFGIKSVADLPTVVELKRGMV